jgi:tripartite-type tricarboxylate transporter receptor subunit TctC
MRKKMAIMAIVIGIIFFSGSVSSVLAEYPERPITLLINFRAGGNIDTLARLLAKSMSDTLGQPILTVNKPGAGGGVGAMELKRAKPDGYTICLTVATTFVFNPHFAKNPKYSMDDFRYIASVTEGQEGFVSLPNKPWKDWKGLIEEARKKGGLTYSSFSPIEKVFMKVVAKQEGVKLIPVPTKGGAGMVPQVLGGHVDFAFSGGIHYSYAKQGKMMVLAALGEKRLIDFPDVPTLKELGYNVVLDQYVVFAAPKDVPEEVVQKVNDAAAKAVKDPNVADLIENKIHWPIAYIGPDSVTKALKKMNTSYREMKESLK